MTKSVLSALVGIAIVPERGGFGGQYVYVIPELDAVFESTADVDVWIPSSAHRRRLVADYVIPALRS